jgi:hypothetical protein
LDTPSLELGSKAAVCITILSGGIVSNALRGSVFHTVLLFILYPAKKGQLNKINFAKL